MSMMLPWIVVTVAVASSVQERDGSFAAEDVFELEFASDPRISPDGACVVYERRSNDIMKDRTRSNLWWIDVETGAHRPLVSGTASASSPRWSPTGDRIAYVQKTDSGTGLYVRWMEGGFTALVANLQQSPSHLTWSRNGRWIAFVMNVRGKTKPIAKPRTKPKGAEWSEPVKVIDQAVYRRDGRGFLETAYSHLFVVPAEGGTPSQLTSGDFQHRGPLSWTLNDERLLFSANRHENWEFESGESDLFSIALANRELQQLTDRDGGESAPMMSPNGEWIAYLSNANLKQYYNTSVLRLMKPGSEEDRALTADLDRSISGVRWSGDEHLYCHFDDRAVRKVARVDLGGERTVVVEGLGGTSLGRPYTSGSFTVSSGGVVASTRGTDHRPADVAITRQGATRVLTALNDDLLGQRRLGAVREIVYPSSLDGQEIQGWCVLPPDYEEGKRYPLILEIHGGPRLAYGPNFSAEIQLMAAAGYVVFYDNHRGSNSYGEAFGMLLQDKYSSPDDFADHMSGVDALIEARIADPDNLFITGGSAGGCASAYAIGLTDRFRAAAVAKPVINWISKTLTADSYIGQIAHQFPGVPWEHLDHYWQRSPLSLVGNMVTPTMLITGEEDYRTPMSETEQLYQALQLKGVDTVMIRVPGSPHGIAGRPSRLIAKVDNILAWFARYRTEGGDGSE